MIGRLEDVYLKAPLSKITFSALRTFLVSSLLKESALLDFLLLPSKRPLSLGSQVESFSLFSTSLTRSVPKDSQPPASLPGVQSLLINAFRSVHLEIFSSSSYFLIPMTLPHFRDPVSGTYSKMGDAFLRCQGIIW